MVRRVVADAMECEVVSRAPQWLSPDPFLTLLYAAS